MSRTVSVASGKAEGGDTDKGGRRQRRAGAIERQRQARVAQNGLQGGVEAWRVDGEGRHGAVAEHQAHFEQPDGARRRLEVAKVHLCCRERALRRLCARGDAGERRELDRVAELGAGAVHLDGREVARRDACVTARRAHDALLCHRVDSGHRLALRVLVDGAAHDHGAWRHRRVAAGVGLEEKEDAALGTDVAVGGGAQRVAASRRREHRGALEGGKAVGGLGRRGDEVDAADEGIVDAAGTHVAHRRVDSHERGRARRVDGECGAMQVQAVGDARRESRKRGADGRVRRGPRVGVVGRRLPAADVHADALTVGGREARRRLARVLESLPCELEGEGMLQVEQVGLRGVDPHRPRRLDGLGLVKGRVQVAGIVRAVRKGLGWR